MKEFNSMEEIEKYYNEELNTYIFKENDKYIDVNFNFDLIIKGKNIHAKNINARDIKAWDIDARGIYAGDIDAYNINAGNIDARNIDAWDIYAMDIYVMDINAYNINANDISFYAVLLAYETLKCNSATGTRKNAKIICLDSEPIIGVEH